MPVKGFICILKPYNMYIIALVEKVINVCTLKAVDTIGNYSKYLLA